MMDPIKVRSLSKFYGNEMALEGVDIDIEPGIFHGIGGRNGSGKTTLFRLILELSTPTSGSIDILDAKFACSYQRPQYFDYLTVGENVRVFSRFSDLGDSEWISEVVEVLGLDEIRGKESSELSAGNSKKLDLSLALIKEPDYLLLDEPFTSLDRDGRESLLGLIGEEVGNRIGGVVIFSHNLEPFWKMLERVTILDGGKVILDGSRREIEEGEEWKNIQNCL